MCIRDRLCKLAAMLRAGGDAGAAHAAVTRQWPGLGPEVEAPEPAAYRLSRDLPDLAPHERMQVIDLLTYLPDDILTKVDRASMAHSLEVRVPFLDHRVLAAGFRLAPELKLRGGETKWILRRMLHDRVPRELIERPKQGFEIPVADWLRGPLLGWADGLIGDTDWTGELGIPAGPVREAWRAHREGRADHADALWSILMLAEWWHGTRPR